jgi:EAL and modified HD-GYP domain-containing signal transduction protein
VGQTAVVRGRLMELLALELLGEDEADQAFVVGVFSLLDVMLNIPMQATLNLVNVPDAVGAALLLATKAFWASCWS